VSELEEDSGQPAAAPPEPTSFTPGEAARPSGTGDRSEPVKTRAPAALVTDHVTETRPDDASCGIGSLDGCAEVVSGSAASVIVMATPRIPNTVSVALEFGKAGHGWAGAIVFNLWLRRQLRARRMSQRQLAYLSGVNHSTISRLLASDRTPSLDTAAKLARALRVPTEDIGADLGFEARRPALPISRVEAALRGDSDLDDTDVRELMEEYIARRRRFRLKAVEAVPSVRGSPTESDLDPPA
jgi:transcriptional regulator with XRE-family HTH domain